MTKEKTYFSYQVVVWRLWGGLPFHRVPAASAWVQRISDKRTGCAKSSNKLPGSLVCFQYASQYLSSPGALAGTPLFSRWRVHSPVGSSPQKCTDRNGQSSNPGQL